MDEATEFSRRRGIPYVEVRYMTGSRYSETVLSHKGRQIGTKSTTYSRGKAKGSTYFLPTLPEDLRDVR